MRAFEKQKQNYCSGYARLHQRGSQSFLKEDSPHRLFVDVILIRNGSFCPETSGFPGETMPPSNKHLSTCVHIHVHTHGCTRIYPCTPVRRVNVSYTYPHTRTHTYMSFSTLRRALPAVTGRSLDIKNCRADTRAVTDLFCHIRGPAFILGERRAIRYC